MRSMHLGRKLGWQPWALCLLSVTLLPLASLAQPPADAAAAEAAPAEPAEEKPKLTRDVLRQYPGAPREAMRGFDSIVPLEEGLKEWGPKRPRQGVIDSMRKDDRSVDRKQIEAEARYRVYSMTDQRNIRQLNSLVQDTLNTVTPSGTTGGARMSSRFRRHFKEELVRAVDESGVLQNGLPVRVNAVLLVNGLVDDYGDNPQDVVPLYLKILEDANQPDAVKYLAVDGLIRAKRRQLVVVSQEREAAILLLSLFTDQTQPIFREKLAEGLGTLRLPATGADPERAEIAVFLGNLALDETQPIRVRLEAARALGRLDVTRVATWNHQLELYILANGMKLAADAFLADTSDPDAIDPPRFRYWISELFGLVRQSLGSAPMVDGKALAEATEQSILAPALTRGEDDDLYSVVSVDALNRWLANQADAVLKEGKIAARAAKIAITEPPPPTEDVTAADDAGATPAGAAR